MYGYSDESRDRMQRIDAATMTRSRARNLSSRAMIRRSLFLKRTTRAELSLVAKSSMTFFWTTDIKTGAHG
jgi:hypothetical protein